MEKLRLVVPKGRIMAGVVELLAAAGVRLLGDDRQYKPVVSDPELEIKVMKPQNIPRLVELGSHDAGFTGRDWILETGADVVERMDLGLDPVRVVAAIPADVDWEQLKTRRLVVATEYEQLATDWLTSQGLSYVLIRTFGATEVFPPDDADLIVDNVSTGQTLAVHGLKPVATLLSSATCFVANRAALADPWKQTRIARLELLFQAVLNGRSRVMLEMNVPESVFPGVLAILPSMRAPTVAPLHGEDGYAVKAAVPREAAPGLVVRLKELGARDILEYELKKVMI